MKTLLILGSALMLAATPALSQRAPQKSDELTSLNAEYRDEQIRARRLRADAEQAATEFASLDRQLSGLRRDASLEDTQLIAQKARLDALEQRETALISRMTQQGAVQGRLLSALQRMSRQPPPPLLIPADQAVDTVRAAILIQAMTPDLQARAKYLEQQQQEISRIRRLVVLSSERLLTLESSQGDRRAEAETLSRRKTALLAVLKADARRAERSASVLEARIRELGGRPPVLEASNTSARATRQPGGQAQLTPPIPGAPDQRFGPGSSGWRWRADAAQAVAPSGGRIDYAGPLEGWGQVVIMELSPGWRAVIAGLNEVAVRTGERVDEGQSLGRSARDGEVYFEIRREDRPTDPAPWLP